MRALKPIKKAIARKWYHVKFSYEHMQKVPRYDPEKDEIVQDEVRVGPTEVTTNQLAASSAEAARIVREGAQAAVHTGTIDPATKRPVDHTPIEGTVVILGVDEWQPVAKKEKESLWEDDRYKGRSFAEEEA